MKINDMFSIRLAVFISIIVVTTGCAQIEIHGTDGTTQIKRHAGVLHIDVTGTSSQMISATGVGLLTIERETTLGWYSIRMLAMKNDCRLVMWVDDPDQVKALMQMLETSALCVSSPKGFLKKDAENVLLYSSDVR